MFTNELGYYPYIIFVAWLAVINVLISQLVYMVNRFLETKKTIAEKETTN